VPGNIYAKVFGLHQAHRVASCLSRRSQYIHGMLDDDGARSVKSFVRGRSPDLSVVEWSLSYSRYRLFIWLLVLFAIGFDAFGIA